MKVANWTKQIPYGTPLIEKGRVFSPLKISKHSQCGINQYNQVFDFHFENPTWTLGAVNREVKRETEGINF